MFMWGNVAEWAGFVGELVVAAAIVWELDETRRHNFLSEVSSPEMYEARGKIYEAFVNAEGKSIAEKSEAIRKRIWSESNFKKNCDEQILLFEKVGTLARYAVFDRIFQMDQFVSGDRFLGDFTSTHERWGERTGPWWAQNFRRLTVRSIGYILKQQKPRVRIHTASHPEAEDLIIDWSECTPDFGIKV